MRSLAASLTLFAMKMCWMALVLVLAQAAGAKPRYVVQSGHRVEIRGLQLSPDGRSLASVADDGVRVWDRSGALRWSVALAGASPTVAWSRDGRRLAVGYGGREDFIISKGGESAGVLEFSTSDGSLLHQLPFGNNSLEHLDYGADGSLQATSNDGVARWNAAYQRTQSRSGDFDFSPDGHWRLRAGEKLGVVDARSNKVVANSPHSPYGTLGVSWSRDSRRLLTFDGRTLWLWSAQGRKLFVISRAVTPPDNQFGPDVEVAIAPDGVTALCARTDYPHPRPIQGQTDEQGAPVASLWHVDLKTGTVQTLRNAAPRFYGALAFWPDGTLVLGGGKEVAPVVYSSELYFARLGAVQPSKTPTLRVSWQEPQPLEQPLQLALSPDGKTLAVGGEDTAVRLWDLTTLRLSKTLKEVSSGILALDYSPDGKQVAALDYNNLFVFDVASGKARKFAAPEAYSTDSAGVAFAPDGQRIALASSGGAQVLDLQSGKARSLGEGWPAPFQWTQDGLWCGNLRALLASDTLKPRVTLTGSGVGSERPGGTTFDFDLAPRGGKLLTVANVMTDNGLEEEPLIQRWNVAGNAVERTINTFHGARCIAVSPDEKQFIAGNAMGDLTAFDFASLQPLWTVALTTPINDVIWSRDGKAVFAACYDGFTRAFSAGGELKATFSALPAHRARSTGYEWLRFAPDGSLATSERASPQLRAYEGARLLSPTQLAPHRQPDLALWHGPALPRERFAQLPQPPVPQPPAVAPTTAPPSPATSRNPKLVLQGGNSGEFSAVAVARGGTWLASSQGEGGQITLWDGVNGLQWDTWPLASGDIPLLFTPDATRLITRTYRHTRDSEEDAEPGPLAICALPSGQRIHTLDLDGGPLWCDNTVLRTVKGRRIVEFDLSIGKKTASRALENAPQETGEDGPSYAFSRNGQYLIEGSKGIIRWWRVQDGKLLGQIKDALRAIGRTAISNDGKWLASEGDDPKWSPPTEASSESAYARTFKLHVWNAAARKVVSTVNGYYSLDGGAHLLEFSADGATLFGAGSGGLDRYTWRTGKNSPLPPPSTNFRKAMELPVALSNDGLLLAGAGQVFQSNLYAPGLQLWSIAQSKISQGFAGTLRGASQVKWSPDGKYLAGGDRLTLWDAHTGALVAENPNTYTPQFDWVDNVTIRTQNLSSTSTWFQVPRLTKVRELDVRPPADPHDPMSDDYTSGASLSPDGMLQISGDPKGFGGKPGLWVWEVATKKLLRTISLASRNGSSTRVEDLFWLPDNARVILETAKNLTLVNVRTGKVEKEWRDPSDPDYQADSGGGLKPLAVSRDGHWLVVRAERDSTALVYDLQTLAFVRRLPVKSKYRAQFSRDDHTAVIATQSGLEWWDVTSDATKPQRVLGLVPDREWTFSPDEKLMAFGSNSSFTPGVSIWSVAEGKERVRLFLLGGTSESTSLDWIALTPEGFYDASPAGEARLRWRDAEGFWPLAKSRAAFKNPAKVAQALQDK